jgi:hypothetical protein
MQTILSIIVVSSAVVGCASHTSTAPQNLDTGSGAGGKADNGTALADSRHLNCQLEYWTARPAFATQNIGAIDGPYGNISIAGGLSVHADYGFTIARNNDPSAQLPFNAIIVDASGATIAYIVLPDLATTDYFDFELGAAIAPTTLLDTTYDHVRAYCSVRAS